MGMGPLVERSSWGFVCSEGLMMSDDDWRRWV